MGRRNSRRTPDGSAGPPRWTHDTFHRRTSTSTACWPTLFTSSTSALTRCAQRPGFAARYVPPGQHHPRRKARAVSRRTRGLRAGRRRELVRFLHGGRARQRAEGRAGGFAFNEWRQAITARSDAAVWPLLQALPAYPIIDARTAAVVTERSSQAANTAPDPLEKRWHPRTPRQPQT
jgi:hypothetical protein